MTNEPVKSHLSFILVLICTGESDPIMKTPIPNTDALYDDKEHSRHTLYCGTEILQTRFYGDKHVLAMVIRTGFFTVKGSVIRSLLYSAPADYKFEKHSYKFLQVLALIAGIGFIYTIVIKVIIFFFIFFFNDYAKHDFYPLKLKNREK